MGGIDGREVGPALAPEGDELEAQRSEEGRYRKARQLLHPDAAERIESEELAFSELGPRREFLACVGRERIPNVERFVELCGGVRYDAVLSV